MHRAGVVHFPGTNRAHDAAAALKAIGFQSVVTLWHQETSIPPCDLVMLPGGFAYGDYLRAGAIAARAPVMEAIHKAARNGTPVLGVCNGFQILCERGLLPGILTRNQHRRFVCGRPHFVIVPPALRTGGAVIRLPVAHGEGNYRAHDADLKRLEDEERVILRYSDAQGEPHAFNGSQHAIAGVRMDNVIGMMPHPENALGDPQDPTRGCGLRLLQRLADS